MDWSAWLPEGDTIDSVAVTAAAGITVGATSVINAGTAVVAWLSGGEPGQKYDVTYHVTTVGGREDDRSITLDVKER